MLWLPWGRTPRVTGWTVGGLATEGEDQQTEMQGTHSGRQCGAERGSRGRRNNKGSLRAHEVPSTPL